MQTPSPTPHVEIINYDNMGPHYDPGPHQNQYDLNKEFYDGTKDFAFDEYSQVLMMIWVHWNEMTICMRFIRGMTLLVISYNPGHPLYAKVVNSSFYFGTSFLNMFTI